MTPINNPAAALTLEFESTPVELHNAIGTGAFQDIDASGTVGANETICIVRVQNNSGGASNTGVRKNGATHAPMEGICGAHASIANAGWKEFLVETDTNGIFEAILAAAGTSIVQLTSWWRK